MSVSSERSANVLERRWSRFGPHRSASVFFRILLPRNLAVRISQRRVGWIMRESTVIKLMRCMVYSCAEQTSSFGLAISTRASLLFFWKYSHKYLAESHLNDASSLFDNYRLNYTLMFYLLYFFETESSENQESDQFFWAAASWPPSTVNYVPGQGWNPCGYFSRPRRPLNQNTAEALRTRRGSWRFRRGK